MEEEGLAHEDIPNPAHFDTLWLYKMAPQAASASLQLQVKYVLHYCTHVCTTCINNCVVLFCLQSSRYRTSVSDCGLVPAMKGHATMSE